MTDVAEALEQGTTLVYPTETCYGLGCDATNAEAVERIYAIKGRTKEKSLILLADSLDMMAPYIDISPRLKEIEQKYWPGALTVIVPIQGNRLAHGVVAGDGTIAFRVTSHPLAQKIVHALGRPLVSTSANVAGGPNSYSADDVLSAFDAAETQPDVVIDGGILPVRAPSTVVRLRGDKIEVVRQGEIIVEN